VLRQGGRHLGVDHCGVKTRPSPLSWAQIESMASDRMPGALCSEHVLHEKLIRVLHSFGANQLRESWVRQAALRAGTVLLISQEAPGMRYSIPIRGWRQSVARTSPDMLPMIGYMKYDGE